jgi:type IV secretion system protein VirB1
MLISHVLAQLLNACAPRVGVVTIGAVVAYESAARPYAIGDNTERRSYFPASRTRAEAIARELLDAGHDIDVGYTQVNSSNFGPFGLSVHDAFEPCTNIAVGSAILRRAYAGAARRYGPGQVALLHALSAYNTGGYWAGLAYAHGVYAAAAGLRWQTRAENGR